jgi:Ras-related protein Rab-2A
MFKRETFVNLHSWLKEVEKHANTDVSIIVIGNKADRALTETPEVSEADMEYFTLDTGITIFTASAKTGNNVEKCFLDLTSHLIDK